MKCVIAILLVFASSQVVYGQSKGSPASRDESHTQATKKPDPEPPPSNTVVAVKQETSNAQGDGTKNDPKSYLARLFAPENLPNIALFFIGVGGIIVAICTLRIIQRQTDAIEKQAEAMINSERAWVIAELLPICAKIGGEWHYPTGSGWEMLSVSEVLKGHHLKHKLKLTNMGRTPAHILRYHIGYSREIDTEGPELRMVDTPKRPDVEFDRLVGGNDSVEVDEIDVFQYIHDSFEATSVSDATGLFSGWVAYQHVFSDTDVLKAPFVYLYIPSAEQLRRVPLRKPEKSKEKKQSPN